MRRTLNDNFVDEFWGSDATCFDRSQLSIDILHSCLFHYISLARFEIPQGECARFGYNDLLGANFIGICTALLIVNIFASRMSPS
jgi:hypothetical protein